jgi:hypothetical protein
MNEDEVGVFSFFGGRIGRLQRGAGLFAACARRADFAVPRGARLLAADAKAGEPDAAAAGDQGAQ